MDNSSFGAWLRDQRQAAGLSLRDLGQRADLDHTYLSKVEAGKVPPPTDEAVQRLARALGDEEGVGAALATEERWLPIRTIRAVLAAYPALADHIERLAHEMGVG